MAITLVQSAHANPGGMSQTISLNGVATGHLLALAIFTGNSPVASVVDSLGNPWIRGCNANAPGSLDCECWYASGAIAGNTAVTITLTGPSFADFTAVLMEFSGVATVNAMEQEVPNAGTSNTPATGGPMQGYEPGEVLMCIAKTSVAITGTPSGFTVVPTGTAGDAVVYFVDSGTGIRTPTFSLGSSQLWLTLALNFRPTDATAPTTNVPGGNMPQIQVEYSPIASPFAPAWRNITRYVRSFKTTAGRAHVEDRINAGTIDIVVDGRDGSFNPWNQSSYLYNGGQGLQPMNVIRITAAWEGVTYFVAYGFVNSILPSYEESMNVDVTIEAYDIFNFLSLRSLSNNNYAQLVEAESSLCAYWRCGDSINTDTMQSSTKPSQLFDSTPAAASGYGPFPGQIINGPGGYPALGAAGSFLYDPSTALDLANGTNLPNGGFSSIGSPLASAAAWTVELWWEFTGGSGDIPIPGGAGNMTLWTTTTAGGELDVTMGYQTIGGVFGTIFNTFVVKLAGVTVSSPIACSIFDGNRHHIVIQSADTAGSSIMLIWVDGQLITGALAAASGFDDPTGMVFGCNAGAINGCPGIISDVAAYSSELSSGTITSHYQTGKWFAMADVGAGSSGTSSGRLNKVLAVAGFAGVLAVSQAFKTPIYGEENPVTKTSALDYIQIQTETEPGLIFQGPDGNIYGLSREYVIGQGAIVGIMNPARAFTSQATWGDSPGATYRFVAKNLAIGIDDLDVWNDIQAESARPEPPPPALQSFRQSGGDSRLVASAAKYGDRTLQGLTSLLFLYDSDALLVAEWYGIIYCEAVVRPDAVTLDNTFNLGKNFEQILGRTLWDQITLEYTGLAGNPLFSAGSMYIGNVLVESINHEVDFDQPTWEATYSFSPYEISNVYPGTSVPALAEPIELGVWTFGSQGQLLL